MSNALVSIFKNADLMRVPEVLSATFRTNKKTGAKIARVVLDGGVTLTKKLTKTGITEEVTFTLPRITSIAQRNAIIRDLAKNGLTQDTIADMLNLSQSTISKILKKK